MSMFDRTALGFLVPESEFKVEDIPDLSGKVAIVTGANVRQIQLRPADLDRPGLVNLLLNIYWNTMQKYTLPVDPKKRQ